MQKLTVAQIVKKFCTSYATRTYYHAHKTQPTILIVSQLYPVQTLFNIIFTSSLGSL
jgi:hypothetical protein